MASVKHVIDFCFDGNESDIAELEADGGDDEQFTVPPRIGRFDSDEEDSESEDEDPKPKGRKTNDKTSWKNKRFDAPQVPFHESLDETMEDRFTWTPFQYFKHFVTDEMLKTIAAETNLYSVQKDGNSTNTNPKELERILGMYLHMGLNQLPSVKAYWEAETCVPAVTEVMTGQRFRKLMTFIHFQNNLSVSEVDKKDKLWKLRPWLEKLRRRFLTIQPEECHAVDEIMVPYKGKSRLRHYMPQKPHKWGFKIWGRAGQSGFLYDFDIFQGATHQEKSEVGPSGDVVLKLTTTLPEGKNHKVFTDNYFTSIALVDRLKERGIYFTGTVRANRLKNCPLMNEKDLKKKGRGSMDFKVNQKNIIIVRWFDNKAVNLLSSVVGTEPMEKVKRWDRRAKRYTTVPRPAIVNMYNKFMGGVDLLDMLTSLYKYNIRSKRWYMYIWWHTITVAVVNAWVLYKRDNKQFKSGNTTLPLRRFQAQVASSLTSAGKASAKRGRPSSSNPLPNASPRKKKKKPSAPPDDVRTDSFDHFAVWDANRQRCKHCPGGFTSYKCTKCNVHLCLVKNRNCFFGYHKTK